MAKIYKMEKVNRLQKINNGNYVESEKICNEQRESKKIWHTRRTHYGDMTNDEPNI